jgi:hypothetical protein
VFGTEYRLCFRFEIIERTSTLSSPAAACKSSISIRGWSLFGTDFVSTTHNHFWSRLGHGWVCYHTFNETYFHTHGHI